MASIINAATSGGLISTGDTSGQLQLQTAGTTALTISSAQAISLTNALPVASGGTGSTTLAGANIATTNSSTQSINSANTFGFKNRIINGGMTIDQRGSASSPVATGYGVDRFTYGNNGAGVVTFGQSTTAPTGFINSSLVTVTTADTSIANTDLYYIYQQIEGLNVADLNFGTASAQTVTLSFWVRSSVTGTYGAVITNSSGNRSYVSNYTINVANTWEQKSITVAGDTSGTWLTTNGIGLSIRWGLAAGSTFQGTANVWGTANAVCSSSQVNFMATVSNTFYITGVQLEVGTQATSFDFRDYGRELMLCQRYFCSSFADGVAPANTSGSIATMGYYTGMVIVGGADIRTASMPFPVSMRTTPTITFYKTQNSSTNGLWAYFNGGGWVTAGSTVSDGINNKGFNADMGISGGSTGQAFICSGMWSSTAEL